MFNPSALTDLPSVLYKNHVTITRSVTSIKGIARYLLITPAKTNPEAPSDTARRNRTAIDLTFDPFMPGYNNSANKQIYAMSRARYNSPVIVCVDWPTTYLIIDMPCMCWKNAHVSKICAHL